MMCRSILKTVALFLSVSEIFGCWTSVKKFNDLEVTCTSLEALKTEGNNQWVESTSYSFYKNDTSQILTADFLTNTPNLEYLKITDLLNGTEKGVFTELKKLKYLILDNNNFSEITPGVFDNLPIRLLSLQEDKIKILHPGCFTNLTNIYDMYLKGNSLTKVSNGVFNTSTLARLTLSNNKIEEIEDHAFDDLTQLTFLALDGNKLKTFEPKRVIGNKPNLVRLWLHGNKIRRVKKSMFEGLPNLGLINLSGNQISSVENGAFDDVKSVYLLALAYNNLEELQPNIFSRDGKNNITSLYIGNNRLTFISTGLLIRLPNLRQVSFGGNPWQCPCLNHFMSWLSNKNITYRCDKEYFLGLRPVCFVSVLSPNDCIYDVLSVGDDIEFYLHNLKDYPMLSQCFL